MSALHDAARQAALDEVARMGLEHPVPRYVVGRIVEAALAVVEQRPAHHEPIVDCEGWDE